MSIRLRLTLVYSAILALTLIVFSAVLYVAQSRYSLAIVRNDLAQTAMPVAAGLSGAQNELGWRMPYPGMVQREGPEGEQARQVLQPLMRGGRRRDSMLFLAADGTPLNLPNNETTERLPIDPAGFEELQTGNVWIQITHDDEGRIFIYNQPVIANNNEVIGIIQIARSLADRIAPCFPCASRFSWAAS